MCNRRRFTLVLAILGYAIPLCFGYKPSGLSHSTQHISGRDGNIYKQPHQRVVGLHAAPVSADEDGRFFADVFSNPAYDHTITFPKKKTTYHAKNKNTLKNLGRCHYEGVLSEIQHTVQTRVDAEDNKGAPKAKKKGAGLSEADKESLLNATDLKRSVVCEQLRWISKRNNARTERVLRTSDFIDGLNFRRLGEADFLVSQLCIGTSMYDNPELIDADHAVEIMETAHKRYGINFFDTCEFDPYPYEPRSYLEGHHRTLREFIRRVGRDNVVLSGRISSSNLGRHKSAGRFLSWVREDILAPPSLKTIEGAVDGLLAALGTDYIDVLSFVYPYRYVPLEHLGEDTYCWARERPGEHRCEDGAETDQLDLQVEVLNELVAKGKVRAVGLSNETVWGTYRIKYHTNRKFKLVCNQRMYNLLHRNEVESSGLVEASLKERFDCPLVAYGALAGGILTGKYIDPERINPVGADKSKPKGSVVDHLRPPDYEAPEDYGHLSYGPSNARCNIFPETFHTHRLAAAQRRTVWSQHATAEYLKLARTYGLTLPQLALAWCFTRPFIAATIVAPRTIGQLHETVAALNYPLSRELEADVHEIFLRYRAPTMGGPQLLTKIDHGLPFPISQNELVRTGSVPIWSGGSHWPMEHIPTLEKLAALKATREDFLEVKRIFGLLDKPNDRCWPNYRCWVERINEGLPGEYFAVKESKLFCWDTMKLDQLVLVNKTPEEVARDDTSDFHFYWKGGKVRRAQPQVFVGPTSAAVRAFYEDAEAQHNVMKQREMSFLRGLGYDRLVGAPHAQPEDVSVWSPVDADLVYKRLLDRHGIDVLDDHELEDTLLTHCLDGIALTEEERRCEKFAYFNENVRKFRDNPPERLLGS